MRNTKEKGFNIVELTITISLIAILNSLLIPIFANLIAKTKNTARQTNLKNAYKNYCLKNAKNAVLYSQNELIFAINDYIYAFNDELYINVIYENCSNLKKIML